MIHRKTLLDKVKKTVLSIDPQAQIVLFGSRARGDARKDSDWDFLILTHMEANENLKKTIHNHLFYTELETEQAISTIIHSRTNWQEYQITPLYKNVKKEGIEL